MPDNVNEIMKRVQGIAGKELADLYRKTCGEDGFLKLKNNTELLRLRICYKLQRKRYGSLSTKHYNQLYKLSQDSPPSMMDKFQLKPGTILTRKWHGKLYQVHVTESGIEYDRNIYQSLTAVTRKITGQERSGPAFFGLNKQEAA